MNIAHFLSMIPFLLCKGGVGVGGGEYVSVHMCVGRCVKDNCSGKL